MDDRNKKCGEKIKRKLSFVCQVGGYSRSYWLHLTLSISLATYLIYLHLLKPFQNGMLSSRLVRRAVTKACTVTRPTVCMRQPAQALRLPTILATTTSRPFSQSAATFGRGTTDEALSARLASEFAIETEMRNGIASDSLPTSIQEFLEKSPFKVIDVKGNEEIKLERKFGNETITLIFNASDINNDTSLAEEEDDDQLAEEEEEILSDDEEKGAGRHDDDFDVDCQIVIRKDTTESVLVFQTVVQDGIFTVHSMLSAPSLAAAGTAGIVEVNGQQVQKYLGPPFAHLDAELQEAVEAYLEERGIDTSLALFIPDYVEFKEGREYDNWLTSVKNFVDA